MLRRIELIFVHAQLKVQNVRRESDGDAASGSLDNLLFVPEVLPR